MRDAITLQIGQRGVVTLPKTIRESYDLNPGDHLTLLDLGGVIILSSSRSEIDAPADHLASSLNEQGETLETMLQALREEREIYAGRNYPPR